MRILIGWLALLVLAAAAGWVQSRWTDEVREERDAVLRGEGERGATDRPDGWSRVLVGRPSGAEPIDVPLPPPPREGAESDGRGLAGASDGPGAPPPPPAEVEGPVFEVRVGPGMVLSKLCAKAYGRGTPAIVDAVARYNGVADPDRIAPGDVLRFPPFDELRGPDGEALGAP